MIALALLAVAPASSPSRVRLSDVHAQLYYESTGRLSDDVLNRPKPMVLWNTIIGEGDAEEPADDLLVTVQLVGDKFGKPEENQRNINDPVVITARGEKGKVLGTRKFTNMLLSTRGVTTLPLWLRDVTCENVDVTVTFRDQTRAGHVKMACGE